MLSLGATRGLRPLAAIISAPTLRPDGTALIEPGYDSTTGLLLVLDGVDAIVPLPDRPSTEQAAEALAMLWKPFSEFPFVGPLDRAAHLGALLTAVVRPSLPTAPAFAYDAPVQGSGKTLLARCVAALATGNEPDGWPASAGADDEETRKRIFTALRDGKRVVVLDHLLGTFDSASLAAALTSPKWTDRVLGKSEAVTVANTTVAAGQSSDPEQESLAQLLLALHAVFADRGFDAMAVAASMLWWLERR